MFLERLRKKIVQYRKPLYFLGLSFLLLAGGWRIFEYALHMERYVPVLEEELEKKTGFPADIGLIDLRLFPTPHLRIQHIRVGDSQLYGSIRSLNAKVDLSGIFSREIRIPSISLDRVHLHLAPTMGETKAIFSTHFPPPADAVSKEKKAGLVSSWGLHLEVEKLHAPQISIHQADRCMATGSLEVLKPLSATPFIQSSFALVGLNQATRFHGELRLKREKDRPLSLTGKAQLADLRVEDMIQDPRTPHTQLDMVLEAQGSWPGKIEATLQGSSISEGISPLTGAFSARAWYGEEGLIVNDFTWKTEDLNFTADAGMAPDGALAAKVFEGSFAGKSLRTLISAIDLAPFELHLLDSASVLMKDTLFGKAPNQAPRLVQGKVVVDGLSLVLEGDRPLLEDIEMELKAEENAIHLERLQAMGVELQGELTPDLEDHSFAIALSGDVLLSDAMMGALSSYRKGASLTGPVKINQLAGSWKPGEDLLDAFTLNLELDKADFSWQTAQSRLDIAEISGGLVYAQGEIGINDLRSNIGKVTGRVIPDLNDKAMVFDLSGEVNLSDSLVRMAKLNLPLSAFGGLLNLEYARGRFSPDQGLPLDLDAAGKLVGGRAVFKQEGADNSFSAVQGTFAIAKGNAELQLNGQSSLWGEVSMQGRGLIASRRGEGSMHVSLAKIFQSYLPTTSIGIWVSALAEQYAPAEIAFRFSLPGPDSPALTVEATRETSPATTLRLRMLPESNAAAGQKKALVVHDYALETTCALEGLKQVAPSACAFAGPATISLLREGDSNRFSAEILLDQAGIGYGEYLRKAPGDAAQLSFLGEGPEALPSLDSMAISCLGEKLVLHLEEGHISPSEFSINLEQLDRLIPEGASCTGLLRGAIQSHPTRFVATLKEVAPRLSPEIAFDRIDGQIQYQDGHWSCSALELAGAKSDCTINTRQEGASWKSTVQGETLDLNALTLLIQAFRSSKKQREVEEEPTQAARSATPPIPPGETALELAHLYYRRGHLEQVRANITSSPEEIRFQDVSMQAYGGAIRGDARLHYPGDASSPMLHLKLNLEESDLRILDDILLPKSRDIHGKCNVSADLSFPVGSGVASYKGLNGQVAFVAQQGSFGKAGLASKLLVALRTTEIIRLNIPDLRDRGLVFSTANGQARFQQGVMNLSEFTLTGKAYAVDLDGKVDFVQNDTDLNLRLYPMESVTGLVPSLPLIRNAVKRIKKTTSIKLKVTGSPFESE